MRASSTPRPRRRSGRAGQVMPVFALMATMCAGFVGVVVDGGSAHARSRFDQNIVDSATLAAAYVIAAGGTETQATMMASTTASLNGCTSPCSLGTVHYLNSGGGDDTNPLNVVSVKVAINDTAKKTFTQVTAPGSNSVPLAGAAVASVAQSTPPTPSCYRLCALGTGSHVIQDGGVGSITVAGGTIATNSSDPYAIVASSVGNITAGTIVTRGTEQGAACGTWPLSACSPSAWTSNAPAMTDPYSAVPYPNVATMGVCGTTDFFGNPVSCNDGATPPNANCGGTAPCTLQPGVYASINYTGTGGMTLQPGTYVVGGGGLRANGVGNVTGTNVTLYVTCAGYVATTANHPCTAGQTPQSCGAAGGISLQGVGSLAFTAPTSGSYTGLSVFFDRNNPAPICLQGVGNLGGTVYAANSIMDFEGVGGSTSAIVVNKIIKNGVGDISIDNTGGQPAQVQDGILGTPKVNLTQ